MRTETIILSEERNVSLTCYIQPVENEFHNIMKRPAVLILPGGGYGMCSDREADPVAFPYLKAGFQVFILRYSVKEYAVWPRPLEDYEEAMEMLREKSDEWHLYPDKIAVIGFSAGGHLAGCAATMARNKPNAAILGYAVLGEDVKGCNVTAPDAIKAVDMFTPPCFLFSTRTDHVVPVDNTTRFMTALSDAGVAFEGHIYSFGPHGFSTADSSVAGTDDITPRASRWVSDSIEWLKELFGDFADLKLSKPKFSARINADAKETYSVDCSFGYLMSNTEARAVLEAALKGKMKEQAALIADLSSKFKNMTLRSIMDFGRISGELVDSIDNELKKIPNLL